MQLNELYNEADRRGVEVLCAETGTVKSLSLMTDSGSCYIGINPYMLSSNADEAVCLAHELGHCVRGAFYNRYSSLDIRSRHERRAQNWAIKKLVPKDELIELYSAGTTDNSEVSEHFGITEEFLQLVLEYYSSVA